MLVSTTPGFRSPSRIRCPSYPILLSSCIISCYFSTMKGLAWPDRSLLIDPRLTLYSSVHRLNVDTRASINHHRRSKEHHRPPAQDILSTARTPSRARTRCCGRLHCGELASFDRVVGESKSGSFLRRGIPISVASVTYSSFAIEMIEVAIHRMA